MIEVRLFATLREGREKILFLDAGDFTSTRQVLAELKIPEEDVAILLINGRHRTPEIPIKDGDLIALFPPVGGG